MSEGDFLEYLELQDGLDLISKTELLDIVRSNGGRISTRQLTTYVSSGLVPKSARIGSRSGVYPKIVAELVVWIDRCRRRGLSVEAISELEPLWRFVKRGLKKREIDFVEFEYLARQFVTRQEAAYAVPNLFTDCLPCPVHEPEKFENIAFIMKDGTRVSATDRVLALSFRLGEYDAETGEVTDIARTCMSIPLGDSVRNDDNAITLGVPNGISWPSASKNEERRPAAEVEPTEGR